MRPVSKQKPVFKVSVDSPSCDFFCQNTGSVKLRQHCACGIGNCCVTKTLISVLCIDIGSNHFIPLIDEEEKLPTRRRCIDICDDCTRFTKADNYVACLTREIIPIKFFYDKLWIESQLFQSCFLKHVSQTHSPLYLSPSTFWIYNHYTWFAL